MEVTSQPSGIILTINGFRTAVPIPGQNYECNTQGQLDSSGNCECGQHSAASSRQSERSVSSSDDIPKRHPALDSPSDHENLGH